jgi:hypothetical protein
VNNCGKMKQAVNQLWFLVVTFVIDVNLTYRK